ncbi:MAG: S-ribosylhomocysteine lyase, partial [Alistipes sp.]|nr:S-ribosylhomocysteine lyase [Alistipes sp.]
MESKKSVVSSFDVDHLTLKEGLYLRSVYTINDELAVHSWDMRFCAPMDHAPLGSGEVHTIEHLMAYHLRLDPVIGKSIVSFCPMGCKTGFYLSTMNNVTAEQIREALLPSSPFRYHITFLYIQGLRLHASCLR